MESDLVYQSSAATRTYLYLQQQQHPERQTEALPTTINNSRKMGGGKGLGIVYACIFSVAVREKTSECCCDFRTAEKRPLGGEKSKTDLYLRPWIYSRIYYRRFTLWYLFSP